MGRVIICHGVKMPQFVTPGLFMAHWLHPVISIIVLVTLTVMANPFSVAQSLSPFPSGQSTAVATRQPESTPTLTKSLSFQTPVTPSLTLPARTSAANPTFEQIVDLGLPAGNSTTPRHLALDSAGGLLYILSEGIPVLEQGTGLSVYDTSTGRFTALTRINDSSHVALDLQLDPTINLAYALWGPSFGADEPDTLSVIDSRSLRVIQEIADVQAIAAAGGLLYLASPGRLTSLAVSSTGRLTRQQQINLPAASKVERLAVDLAANRLYVAGESSRGWSADIYTADTLTLLTRYPTQDPIFRILPNPPAGEVYVIEDQLSDRLFHRLTADARLLGRPERFGRPYGGQGLALTPDGAYLYSSSNEIPSAGRESEADTRPGLIGLTLPSLAPSQTIPLLTQVDDLVIDANGRQAFALYPFDNLLYLIDLVGETSQIAKTAVEIRGMLVDDTSGELFVSDSTNRIRRLAEGTFEVLAETNIPPRGGSYGFNAGFGDGELTLDQTRNRLYVSGSPAYVLDAETLIPIDTLEPGGQFALSPGDNEIYLSQCGISILDAQTLISHTVISSSTQRDDQLVPNPCVSYSQLDAANQLLYSLAPNNVPGSNSGTLLYIYDLGLAPSLIFSDSEINITQALPDPTHQRAFVSQARATNIRLRTLAISPTNSISYTHQVSSLSGRAIYSPQANRLYLSDRRRLLVLDADSLDVVGEMPLPPNYDFRLAAFNANSERLYLAGYDGRLLVASGAESASRQENLAGLAAAGFPPPNPAQVPTGSIVAVEALPEGQTLGLINTAADFSQDTRLYRTADGSATWTDLSQNLPPQLLAHDVALSPNYTEDQTLFVTVGLLGNPGGLYKSTDGGRTWAPAMTGLSDLSPNQLFIAPDFGNSPTSSQGFIMANTRHAGLHYSGDGGQTWQPLIPADPNTAYPSTTNSAAAISDNHVVLASQILGDSEGVFRATITADGSLSPLRQVLDTPLTLLAFAPEGRTAFGFGSAMWRSTDGGRTWLPGGAGLTELDRILASRFLFSPNFAADRTVYLFFRDIRGDQSGRFFRSTDAGQSWQLWDNPPRSRRFTSVSMTPAGDFLFGDDQAQLTPLSPSSLTWAAPQLPPKPFTIDDLAVSPSYAQDRTLFAVSHRYGLFKSSSGGRTWNRTGFSVRSTSFEGYRLGISPAYDRDQTLFVATGFSLHRSTDGGRTWTDLRLNPQRSGFKAERVAVSPNFAVDNTLLVSSPQGITRSTDRGDTWKLVLAQPETAGRPSVLAFTPTGNRSYAWFDFGDNLFVSADGGQTWQTEPIRADEPFGVTTAAAAPDGTLILRPDFYPQLFRIGRQGQIQGAFTDVLPPNFSDVQTMAFREDGTLIVGGIGGLAQSTDNGQTWQVLDTGLPPGTTVTLLRPADTRLFVILNQGQILTSTDGGASWVDISVIK